MVHKLLDSCLPYASTDSPERVRFKMRGVRNNGGAQHETVIKRAACLGLSGTALVALNSNELFPPDVSADGTVGVTSWDCITNKIKRSSSATWCDNNLIQLHSVFRSRRLYFTNFQKGQSQGVLFHKFTLLCIVLVTLLVWSCRVDMGTWKQHPPKQY